MRRRAKANRRPRYKNARFHSEHILTGDVNSYWGQSLGAGPMDSSNVPCLVVFLNLGTFNLWLRLIGRLMGDRIHQEPHFYRGRNKAT